MSKAAYQRYRKALEPYIWTGQETCSECGDPATERCVWMRGTYHVITWFACSRHKDVPSWFEWADVRRYKGKNDYRWTSRPQPVPNERPTYPR